MSRVRPWAIAAVAYGALAIVVCRAVLAHPATTIPSDLGDPLLNTWILWWNAHAVPLTRAWWDAPFFFPMPGALALSETLLGLAIVTTPLQWAGLGVVAAYNVAFAASFALSALAMHALVWRLTRRHDSALIGALIYGFNPYRIAHAAHIQLLSSYWLPLAFLGLHAYVETRRPRALALFAVSWLLQAWISGYFLFYSAVLVALWAIWFAREWRARGAIVLAWLAAVAASAPILLEYRRIQEAGNLTRGIPEIEAFGADLSSLLAPSDRLLVWGGRLVTPRAEGELFIGFTAIALAAVLLARVRRVPIGRASLALLGLAAIPALVGLTAHFTGGFALGAGALRITVTRAFKPISFAVWFTVVAIVASGPFRDAWRRRSLAGFYLAATLAMIAFALGPAPRIAGHRFWYQPPYRWLLALPGMSGVRVPARFGTLVVLCAAVAAALGYDRLRASGRLRPAAWLAIVLAGLAADSASRVPAVRVPGPAGVPRMNDAAAVLELPLGHLEDDVRAMFHAMTHRRPLVNGYSGYAPRHYEALAAGIRDGDTRTFDVLRRHGRLDVLFANGDQRSRDRHDMLAALGARIESHGAWSVASFEAVADATTRSCAGATIPIAAARGNSRNDAAAARDGRLDTAWHSDDVQKGGEQIVVDLGALHTVETIAFALGPYSRDFPRRLRIETSADAAHWTEVWHDATVSYALEGALADAAAAPVRIPLPAPASARWIAVTQTGQATDAVWSVAEIDVCGR